MTDLFDQTDDATQQQLSQDQLRAFLSGNVWAMHKVLEAANRQTLSVPRAKRKQLRRHAAMLECTMECSIAADAHAVGFALQSSSLRGWSVELLVWTVGTKWADRHWHCPRGVAAICHHLSQRGITADQLLRVSEKFSSSDDLWLSAETAAVRDLGELMLAFELLGTQPPRLMSPQTVIESTLLEAHPWLGPLEAVAGCGPQISKPDYLYKKRMHIAAFLHAMERLSFDPAGQVRVADIGTGEGWLAFASHWFLRRRAVEVYTVGVEVDARKTQQANSIAAGLGAVASGLDFQCSSGGQFLQQTADVGARFDLVTALHCCDTGTDVAIQLALQCAARYIIVVPCCYQQHRRHIRSAVHKQAALALLSAPEELFKECVQTITDCVRCGLLEDAGYDTERFEFMPREYGNHNVMILATRRDAFSLEQRDVEAKQRERSSARTHKLMEVVGVRN